MPELDLGTFLQDDALVLKGVPSEKHPQGQTYRLKSPSAKVGLLLQRMLQVTADRGIAPVDDNDVTTLQQLVTDDNGDPIDLTRRLLGDVYDAMVDDGVSAERFEMIRSVVMAHYGMGPQVAKMLVEQWGEAQARENRAARRTAKKTAGSKSRRASTAATESVKGRTSTSGSSTSPKEREEKTAKAV